MCENTGQAEMLAFCELPREAVDVPRRNSQTIHSGIDLQMETGYLGGATRGAGCASSRAFEQSELIAAREGWRQAMLDDALFLARPKTSHHQDRLFDAGIANLDAFFGAGDPEPIRSSLFQGFGARRSSVPVSGAFYNGKNLSRLATILVCWIDVLADRAQVIGQRSQVYFGPDLPARKLYLSFMIPRHFGPYFPERKNR